MIFSHSSHISSPIYHLSISLISELCVIGSTGEEEHTYSKALFDWESGKWATVNDGFDWRRSFCVMRSFLSFEWFIGFWSEFFLCLLPSPVY